MTSSRGIRALLLAVSAVLVGCSSFSTTSHSPRITCQTEYEIRSIGNRAVKDDGMVGLSIGVAIDGVIVFSDGFGNADSDRSVSATAGTIYDIGSIGKQFTAVAILQLAERGELSLGDRVRSFVPELPPHFPDATIEQLLRHTSGFVSEELDELNAPIEYTRPRYGLELLSDVALQAGRMLFTENETWVYSNAGYLVLGLVVEAASGMRYDQYIRQHVLEPLAPHSMRVGEYAPPPQGSERLRRTHEGVAPVPFIHMSAYGGQGSICSSVIDLLHWSDALNDGRIISRNSLSLFRSTTQVRGAEGTAEIPYGMAQRFGSIDGHSKVGHTGTFDGGSAALAYYPGASLEIAVITNTRGQGTPHAYHIETEIAKLILGIPAPDVRAQRTPVTHEQRQAIEGAYTNGNIFVATIERDELVAMRDGREIARLVHIGGMRFRDPDAPDVFEWFIMDGKNAGWWVHSVSGNFLEVVRRVEP